MSFLLAKAYWGRVLLAFGGDPGGDIQTRIYWSQRPLFTVGSADGASPIAKAGIMPPSSNSLSDTRTGRMSCAGTSLRRRTRETEKYKRIARRGSGPLSALPENRQQRLRW